MSAFHLATNETNVLAAGYGNMWEYIQKKYDQEKKSCFERGSESKTEAADGLYFKYKPSFLPKSFHSPDSYFIDKKLEVFSR